LSDDSIVAAEAALLGCSILLTSDEHLRGIDHERLSVELQAFDVAVPVSDRRTAETPRLGQRHAQ